MLRNLTVKRATVTLPETTLIGVRFIAAAGDARILDSQGRTVWHAVITGIEATDRNRWRVVLLDGPDVMVVRHCDSCRGR